jgi:hypothetical protein
MPASKTGEQNGIEQNPAILRTEGGYYTRKEQGLDSDPRLDHLSTRGEREAEKRRSRKETREGGDLRRSVRGGSRV